MVEVADDVVEGRNAAPVAMPFLGLLDAAECQKGVSPCRLRRQALAHGVVNVQLQVSVELAGEVFIASTAACDGA